MGEIVSKKANDRLRFRAEFAPLTTIRGWSKETFPPPPQGDHTDGVVSVTSSSLPLASQTAAFSSPVSASSSPLPGAWQTVTDDEDAEYSEECRALIKAFLQAHGFKWYSVLLYVFSIACYLADVISDAYLTITYYRQVSVCSIIQWLYRYCLCLFVAIRASCIA